MIRLLSKKIKYLLCVFVFFCCCTRESNKSEFYEGSFKDQRIILIINNDSLFSFNEHTQNVIGHFRKKSLPHFVTLNDDNSEIKIQNNYVYLKKKNEIIEPEILNKLAEYKSIVLIKSKLLGEWQIEYNNLKRGILYKVSGSIEIYEDSIRIKNDNRKMKYYLTLPSTINLSFNDYVQSLKISFQTSNDSLLFIARNKFGNKVFFSSNW